MTQIKNRADAALAAHIDGNPAPQGQASPWPLFLLAVGLLTLMMPPNGALSGNEEYYLYVAQQIVDPQALPPQTALFRGMPHTFLFAWIFGPIVEAFGYPAAQIAGRCLAILLYAAALTRLWRVARLGALELGVVLLAFGAAGQMLFGNDWMFHSIESKVLAYVGVLFAAADYLEGRLQRCFVLLAAATWFHFLAGGMWAGIFTVALMLRRDGKREWLLPAAIFAALIAPLLIYLVVAGYASASHVVAHAKPTPAWIYSFVAMPAHSMPSKDLQRLLIWLPGMGATLAVFLAALRLPSQSPVERDLARLVVVGCGYLLLMIAITYLDRTGTLGPFLVFRPASVTLFFAMMIGASLTRTIAAPLGTWLRRGLLVLLLTSTVPMLAYEAVHAAREQAFQQDAHRKLVSYIRERTAADSRFLIVEIPIEERFDDFERTTGRALLVMYRFVPAFGDELIEWYHRHEFRAKIRRQGCSPDAPYSPDYLLASSEKAYRLAASCGPVVFDDGSLALIHYEPPR